MSDHVHDLAEVTEIQDPLRRYVCQTCHAITYAEREPDPEWDDEAWCAHGGHVHPSLTCPFCPEAPRD